MRIIDMCELLRRTDWKKRRRIRTINKILREGGIKNL